jgi:hypothetical protein
MFKRRGAKGQYSKAQAMRWLSWLAQRMSQEFQTVFLIERMQPTWLQTKSQRTTYRIGSGLIPALSNGVFLGLLFNSFFGLIWGIIALIVGALISLLGQDLSIIRFETLRWDWKNILFSALVTSLVFGVFGVFGFGPFGSMDLPGRLIAALIVGLPIGLITGLKSPASDMEVTTIPNQGIWNSIINTGVIILLCGLLGGFLGMLFNDLSTGLFLGLFTGLATEFKSGNAQVCIQHFILRFILYRKGYIPWNYVRFLDYAADHIFLQKVGGGYIFIHRLLLEHFAQMEPEQVRR